MELEEKGKQIVGIKLDSLLYLQQGTDLFQQFVAKDCEMKTLTLVEEKSSLKFVIKIKKKYTQSAKWRLQGSA